jgi:hypothetical protein
MGCFRRRITRRLLRKRPGTRADATVTTFYDLTGYILGIASILYGVRAKRYRLDPKKLTRWLWIGFGVIAITGNITQNIIEFQER